MSNSFESNEVGSETGIEQKESPKVQEGNGKSDFDWLASIKNIFHNILGILKIIIKWR